MKNGLAEPTRQKERTRKGREEQHRRNGDGEAKKEWAIAEREEKSEQQEQNQTREEEQRAQEGKRYRES